MSFAKSKPSLPPLSLSLSLSLSQREREREIDRQRERERGSLSESDMMSVVKKSYRVRTSSPHNMLHYLKVTRV